MALTKSTTDPLGYATEHRYDGLRRLRRVVQAYLSNGVDPANWIWDAGQSRWEDGSNNAINHTSINDRNIIADVTLDVAGRQTSIRDPRGNQTTYAYDWLNRRTGLTDPLNNTWATAYTDLSGGQSRVVSTLPSPLSHQTEQNFDRLGRVIGVNYLDESPKLTPDVAFSYDISGNRTLMHEFDGATTIRRTEYSYDAARRLSQVGYDNDGSGTVDQAISYEYDRGGLRTQMTLPGNLTITYTYDQRGQLLGLTDWDNQPTQYAYDAAGRLVNMERPNGLCSTYSYDTASRLKKLRHASKAHVLGHFAYELDARGNRTKAFEALPQRDFGATTISYSDAAVEFYHGTWTSSGGFMQTSDKVAALRVAFFGERADLTLGVGTDHGICDIYLDDTFWGSVDTYAHPTGIITLNLADEGPHLLDIRNRADKNLGSNGYKLRFKQLKTSLVSPLYDLQTVAYTYDALGRLTDADHFRGKNIASNPFLTYGFTYDLAGNRTQEDVSGSYVPRSFTYDAANRLVQVGGIPISYDAAGRALRHLTEEDNNLFYTWDRAGRMTYAEERPSGSSTVLNFIAPRYNGLGQKISQTESPYGVSPGYLTTFLLDPQPGLWKVVSISHDNSPLPEHYIHGPLGIQAYNVPSSPNPLWYYSLQDGLGSVRAKVLNTLGSLAISQRTHYAPYGQLWGEDPAPSPFGFTGEPTDINSLVHLRARYYNPALGVFPSLDPLEGSPMQPMSLNRYAYVQGNPTNAVDPSGLIAERPPQACNFDVSDKCCGFDVTEWFVNELRIHSNFINGILANAKIPILPFQPFTSIPEFVMDEATIWQSFRTYARAIPYKWMTFVLPGQSSCPSDPQCSRGVTLCGKCIDRSELGNIMFGWSGAKASLTKDTLFLAARQAGALKGTAEIATAGIGYYLSWKTINSSSDLCHHIQAASGSFNFSDVQWDWSLANVDQDVDISVCKPCNDLLPAWYPNTYPSLTYDASGTSPYADSSVGEGDWDDKFYIDQIPSIEYLAPELCMDLTGPISADALALCGSPVNPNGGIPVPPNSLLT